MHVRYTNTLCQQPARHESQMLWAAGGHSSEHTVVVTWLTVSDLLMQTSQFKTDSLFSGFRSLYSNTCEFFLLFPLSPESLHIAATFNLHFMCCGCVVDLDHILTASARLHGSSMPSWWSCIAIWRRCTRTCWSTLQLIPRRPLWRSCSLISATFVPCSL